MAKNKGEKVRGQKDVQNRLRGLIGIYGILWKQYLSRHRFWFLFLFLFSAAAGLWNRGMLSGEEEYGGILAGVCIEDEKGEALLEKLQSEKGIFRFLGYNSQEEMIRQVENGTLECGYVLPGGFYENILKGKRNRQIILYYSPASTAHKISYEVVFASLFEILSEDILSSHLQESGLAGEGNRERLLALNREYGENGSTFHFVYETVGEKEEAETENLSTLRGLGAVMMFFMGLLGVGNVQEQERTWKGMPGLRGRLLKGAGIHIAAAGAVFAGAVGLWVSGTLGSPGKEGAALLLYLIVLEVFLRGLCMLVRKERALYGIMPALVLGSFLFCPVFIRIDRYLPAAAWLSGLFPPYYYLKLF